MCTIPDKDRTESCCIHRYNAHFLNIVKNISGALLEFLYFVIPVVVKNISKIKQNPKYCILIEQFS